MRYRNISRLALALALVLALGSTPLALAQSFYTNTPANYADPNENARTPDLNSAFQGKKPKTRTYTYSHASTYASTSINSSPDLSSPVEKREINEEKLPGYFSIQPYMPNYILPFYYTGSPYNSVYENNTPNDESLKHDELKFQLSLKVPLWRHLSNHSTFLYFAYTQQSFWQVYNHYAFFRETDYQPEIFIAHQLDFKLPHDWHFDFLDLGAVHQSNGFGNFMERTWNRVYLEAILSNDNWVISVKPWYILSSGSTNKYNPDIASFLGYGRLLIAYKIKGHVFSLTTHNIIEGHARSATGEFTWSFPLTTYLKGYVQVFSGYGQSLIEYNHRTNSAGIGFALNDWI